MPLASRRSGLRRALTSVLALLVVVDLALVAGYLGHRVAVPSSHSNAGAPHDGERRTQNPAPERPASDLDASRAGAVRLLLAKRATALRKHDKAAFMAGIDPRSPTFRAAQSAYFANLAQVPLSMWSYTVDASTTVPTRGREFRRYGAQVWVPRVIAHFALRGYDPTTTSQELYYTFVRRSGRWYIASDTDGESRGFRSAREIWDFGPVRVVHGERTLVLGHPDSRFSLRALSTEVDDDIPRVTDVWGAAWSRLVVVIVPSSETELAKILADEGTLTQIAAVATAELGGGAERPVGDRIMINPVNWTKLGPLGRQVVLTHEITHVASRAATGSLVPTWLVEGIADYVGYRSTGVPVSVAARELARDLQQGRSLGGLPSDTAYDGKNSRLAQAYEKSWLACKLIAERWGQRNLVKLYRVVGAVRTGTEKAATDRGLRAVLGISLASFTSRWQAYVRNVLT